MIKLLVITDDFTGALDTGVQFSKQGISTLIAIDKAVPLFQSVGDAQVLVVDTESRHLSPKDAYQCVKTLVQMAKVQGVKYIYKKTDSALRGNIGAELSAVTNAFHNQTVYFVPAFPVQGRTTRNGIHYVNGVPVSDSVFGKDPFEPVIFSNVADIIHSQSDIPVTLSSLQDINCCKGRQIIAIDAASEADIRIVCDRFKKMGIPTIMAGCAGFAAHLAELLKLTPQKLPYLNTCEKIMVLSGSVNPITFKQQKYAQKNGFTCVELKPEQKLTLNFCSKEEGYQFLDSLEQILESNHKLLIVAASNDQSVQATDTFARKMKLLPEQARVRIARNLGQIAAEISLRQTDSAVFLIGGDTLISYLHLMHAHKIEPLRELVPGVVQAKLHCSMGTRNIISKSGGFSSKDVIIQVTKMLRGEISERKEDSY